MKKHIYCSSEVQEYRKKPVVVQAIYFGKDHSKIIPKIIEFCKPRNCKVLSNDALEIETLEGNMIARKGDYVIKGIKGEVYPCKEDVFNSTYEFIGEQQFVNLSKVNRKIEYYVRGHDIECNKIYGHHEMTVHPVLHYTNKTSMLDVMRFSCTMDNESDYYKIFNPELKEGNVLFLDIKNTEYKKERVMIRPYDYVVKCVHTNIEIVGPMMFEQCFHKVNFNIQTKK